MPGPECRIDVLTGRQVIVAAQRAARPVHVAVSAFSESPEDDPFLEGHEHNTPHERLALRTTTSNADKPGWLLRVVPNLYPAVMDEYVGGEGLTSRSQHSSVFALSPAVGVHDVVIECPDHRTRMSDLTAVEVARAFFAWRTRMKQIRSSADANNIQAISIFRNEGTKAGASLPHCHSQILATNFIGNQLAERVERSCSYRKENGGCLYRHWLESELVAQQRVVMQNGWLAVMCPYASRVPWHTRFCPMAGATGDFQQLTESELLTLAETVHAVVRSLDKVAGELPHNLVLTTPPTAHPDAFPWMLDLLPRPSRIAGYELQTDVDIITTAPEDAAEQIRTQAEWNTNSLEPGALCPSSYAWRGTP